MASVETADQQGQNQTVSDNKANGAPRTYISLAIGKVGDRVNADDRPDTAEVSKVIVPVSYHTQDLPAHVVQLATALTFVG